MHHPTRQVVFSCAAALFCNLSAVKADLASDAEIIFNAAEVQFQNFFPSHQLTQQYAPYLFRYYPSSSIYLGINSNDQGVYLLGGEFGSSPYFVGSLADIKSLLGLTSEQADTICDTSNIPAGISYSQEGNVVTITTNGQCVSIPTANLCEPNPEDVSNSTGDLSVLTSTEMSDFYITGISYDFQGFDLTDTIAQNFSSMTCMIHAPDDFAGTQVNYDVCYDITDEFESSLGNTPGVNIYPPVEFSMTGFVDSQIVSNCFATNADSIIDLQTQEVWLNQNGSFIKIP